MVLLDIIRERENMWTFATTEKSIALREIRENDVTRYVAICKVLAEPDIEMTNAIPLKYAYDLADEGKSPEEETILSELKKDVTYALNSALTAREERVIRKSFYDDVTDVEIGREFSVTGGRIGGIREKSLRKMKNPSVLRKLVSYLPDVIEKVKYVSSDGTNDANTKWVAKKYKVAIR